MNGGTLEIVYVWPNGREEVRYRRPVGTDDACRFMAEVDEMKARATLTVGEDMNATTKELFSHQPYGVPRQKRGHVPELHRTRTGVAGKCSCGKTLARASGCNRGGVCYALANAYAVYVGHCKT